MCTVCAYIFNHPLLCYCIILPFYITTVSTGVHLHPRQLIQHHRHPGPKSWDITEENVRLSFLHYYQMWRAWLEDRLNLSPPGVGGIASPFLAGWRERRPSRVAYSSGGGKENYIFRSSRPASSPRERTQVRHASSAYRPLGARSPKISPRAARWNFSSCC